MIAIMQSLNSSKELPPPDPDKSCNVYLTRLVIFAHFAGKIWDSVSSIQGPNLAGSTAILDVRIKYWMETHLSTLPLLPQNETPTKRHLWQYALVRTVVFLLKARLGPRY